VSHVRGAPPSTPEQIPASIKAEIERTTWLDFACIVLVLVGVMNIIGGLSAITGANYVIDHLLFANLHAWGWLVLIWGILQLFAAAAVYRGAPWGTVVAIATAVGNAIIQISWVDTYPVWSLAILALDILLIYGLVTRVGLGRRAR